MQMLIIFAMMAIIGSSWWPSHKFFTWFRTEHHSMVSMVASILGCAILTSLLVSLGWEIGQHINNLWIRSLDSKSGDTPSTVNLFWFPFALFALGIWAGFLSGYMKMKIYDKS